jgi:hypothetical protein
MSELLNVRECGTFTVVGYHGTLKHRGKPLNFKRLSCTSEISFRNAKGLSYISKLSFRNAKGLGYTSKLSFRHAKGLIINNLTIIVIHTTYSILLFTDFYDDMFRSLYDHLQVV